MSELAVVFDKAAWHLDSVREHGLPDAQAYVHGGLFFGWVVDRGLHAAWLEQSTPEAFARYRKREITGPELLATWDGAVLDDMFGDMGLAFVVSYFDPRSGAYFGDYIQEIAKGLPSEFHVPDTAESAARVAALLDRRFAEWRASWDPASGRPELRRTSERAAPSEPSEVSGSLELGIIVVTAGVVLPGGPLGVRVGRPGSRAIVEQAASSHRLLGLLGSKRGRKVEYSPDDLLEIGVVAEILTKVVPEDRPDALDITLSCLKRMEVEDWADEEALIAKVRVLEAPEPTEEELGRLEEIRHLSANVVRQRTIRGEPPGMLALAMAQQGAALVDLVARELLLSREESLTVLESPELGPRIDVVVGALTRES
jgi:Lon protease-like protein